MPEPLRRAGEALWEGALYTLSLPERYLRGLTALLGGMLKETTDLLVPDFVKDTTSYNLFVGNILRFAVENVGGVEGVYDDEGLSGDYATRKLLGNAIEGIGVATVHLSPLWVFAFGMFPQFCGVSVGASWAGCTLRCAAGASASCAALARVFAPRCGASTIVMLRPSCLADVSTKP